MTVPFYGAEDLLEETPGYPYRISRHKTIIAMAGGKGGVGKTVTTASIGIALAEAGKSTVVVDADFGGANLHQSLGFMNPHISVLDFFTRQENDLNKLLLNTSIPYLRILAGAPGAVGLANLPFWIKLKLFRHINRINAEFIVLDIGAGAAFNQLDYFNYANLGLVVITPEPFAIQDGFNFLKVALLRKLYRKFRKVDEIRAIFKKLLRTDIRLYPISIKALTEEISHLNGSILYEWVRTIKAFKPAVVINMVEDKKDQVECLALQVAAKEILDIDLNTFCFVHYDDNYRKGAKLMRPDLLMANDGLAANDIRVSVKHYLDEDVSALEKHIPNSFWSSLQSQDDMENEDIICSIKCTLWGRCSAQNGGYPCRIKVIGFANQKK